MGRPFKYNPGDRLGPENILFLEERPKKDGKRRRGLFECPRCGGIFETDLSKITSGHTKSCGCLPRGSYQDLSGQKFGKLTVKQPIKQRSTHGDVMWECICDCGNITYISTHSLITKRTQSCGCLHSKDLAGKRFGKLIALEPTDKRKRGYIIWKCKCDCGNITYVSTDYLERGVQSCGCLVSKGEAQITKILTKNNIKFEKQKTFNTCKNPDTNYLLRFDFYLPDYNTCIEFDGEQHFKPIKHFGGKERFKQQQKNDQIKNDYCVENNIALIRISDYSDEALDSLIKEIRKEKVC